MERNSDLFRLAPDGKITERFSAFDDKYQACPKPEISQKENHCTMPPPPRPVKTAAAAWIKGEADDLASMAALDEQILLAEIGFRYQKDKI